jgi:hypothetical protein
MDVERLSRIFTTRGIENRVKDDEVVIRNCLRCGNPKWNLECNAEKGVYHCWACKDSGTINSLFHDLGIDERVRVDLQQDHARPDTSAYPLPKLTPIYEVESAKTYLERRGIDITTALRYKLGVVLDKEHSHYGRIVIPVYDYFTMGYQGYISRSYYGKSLKYLREYRTGSFLGHRGKSETHVIVEGPFDAIKVAETGHNVYMLGGLGEEVLLKEWCCRVPLEDTIKVLLDPEAYDQAMRIYWTLYPIREVEVVRLEDKDPGDCTVDELKEVLG